jgi:hypothetical protein
MNSTWLPLLLACWVDIVHAAYCHRPDLGCGSDLIWSPTDPLPSIQANASECQKACDDDPMCPSIRVQGTLCFLLPIVCRNSELEVWFGENDYYKHEGECGKLTKIVIQLTIVLNKLWTFSNKQQMKP